MTEKMSLVKFLGIYMDPILLSYGFARKGYLSSARSDDGVTAWVDFRPARRQTQTVTFRVDVGFGLDDFFVKARRGILPEGQILGLSLDIIHRMHTPNNYTSLLIDPTMKQAWDLFSFFEDGERAEECADAFRQSWEERTWPWLEPRLTLDGMERVMRHPPREYIAIARRRLVGES